MARPNIAHERRPRIIAAAKAAIAKYGLAGATQERISQEAGLSRSHIRHYLGNRSEVIDAVWEATLGPYLDGLRASIHGAPTDEVVGSMLAYMFGPALTRNLDDAVIDAFLNVATHDDELGQRMYRTYSAIEDEITAVLVRATETDGDSARAVSFALICMTAGNSTMSALPFPRSRAAEMPAMATALIGSIANRPRNG